MQLNIKHFFSDYIKRYNNHFLKPLETKMTGEVQLTTEPITTLFAPLSSNENIRLNKLISVYENIIELNTRGTLDSRKLSGVKRQAMKLVLKYNSLPEEKWELADRKWYHEHAH